MRSRRAALAHKSGSSSDDDSGSQLYVGPTWLPGSSKMHFIKGVCNGRPLLSAADVRELQLQLGEWAKPSWQVGAHIDQPSAVPPLALLLRYT